jgi:hypothetical protein
MVTGLKQIWHVLQIDWMRQKFGSFMKDIPGPGAVFELPVKTPALSCKCIMYAYIKKRGRI